MHEYSLVRAMVDRVEQEARARNATAISRLAVRIGAMSGVEPRALRLGLHPVPGGDPGGRGARHPARPRRPGPARSARPPIPTGAVLRCAACDVPARMVTGDEILLEQIEMEVP